MSFIESLGLILVVVIGGGIGLYFKNLNKTILPKMILTFGGAYLLSLSFVELLPKIYLDVDIKIGMWILVGFLIQLLLEQFSKGVEHGHMHMSNSHSRSHYLGVMIGLCLHAFLEGFPLQSDSLAHDHDHGYFWGIMLHKLPAAFALASVLSVSKLSKTVVFGCIFMFGLMTPLGAYFASFLNLDEQLQKIVLAIVIGLFLHIATTILFEIEQSDHHHSVSWIKLVAILAGFAAALLV